MRVILLACLFSLSFAGQACLPKGWELTWKFLEGEIEFTLVLNQETLDKYGWVGIGFQYPFEDNGMEGADITNIILSQLPTDNFAEYNGLPELDIEIGGTDDVYDTSKQDVTFTWKRPLASGDNLDKEYIEDDDYSLLWACGKMMGDIQMKHFVNDRDKIPITLSESFIYGCTETTFLQLN